MQIIMIIYPSRSARIFSFKSLDSHSNYWEKKKKRKKEEEKKKKKKISTIVY